MTYLIGAHGRNDLCYSALERPSGLEAEPCLELFKGDAVVTFVDQRVVGNDLGLWGLLVDEFGDVTQGVILRIAAHVEGLARYKSKRRLQRLHDGRGNV